MKNLLKLSFVLAFVATTCISNAQSNSSKLKFGVKAGFNLADMAQNFKDSEEEYDTKTLTGLAFGVTAEYELKENLAFQSGLMFTQKGFKYDGSDNKIKVTWLEVPMNFAYKMNDFQVYAGPYVAFGLSGKYEWDDSEGSGSEDLDFGNSDSDDLRGFDYGLNFGLGYQTGNILFNAGYSLGLANLTPNDSDGDWKQSNRVISFSVSYFFGK